MFHHAVCRDTGAGLVGVDSDEHDEAGISPRALRYGWQMHEAIAETRFVERDKVFQNPSKRWGLGVQKSGGDLGFGIGECLKRSLILRDSSVAGPHFGEVYPFHPGVKKMLARKKVVVMENNATGQFANLLGQELGIEVSERILKYDGAPFSVEEVMEKIRKISDV